MGESIRTHAATISVAMMTALVIGSLAPAMAGKGPDAGTVDGIHATKYTTTKAKRKNKLVAANKAGLLPNNIIKKAPNSNKLDGLDSSDFAADVHNHDADDIEDGPGSELDADSIDGLSSEHFVKRNGDALIFVQADVTNWEVANISGGSYNQTIGLAEKIFTPTSASGNATLYLHPDVPTVMYGKEHLLAGIEVCYDATTGHEIDAIAYNKVVNSNGVPTFTNMQLDPNDRNDEACRLYTAEITDKVLQRAHTPVLEIKTQWTDMTPLRIGRTTLYFEPTNNNATEPF